MGASRSGPLVGDLEVGTPCGGLDAEALGGDDVEAPHGGASRPRPLMRSLRPRPHPKAQGGLKVDTLYGDLEVDSTLEGSALLHMS